MLTFLSTGVHCRLQTGPLGSALADRATYGSSTSEHAHREGCCTAAPDGGLAPFARGWLLSVRLPHGEDA